MRRLLTWTTVGMGALALAACTKSSSVGGEGGSGGGNNTSSSGTGTLTPQSKVDKIDIVLGIDNSRSMADKQEILSLALSDLVQSLTNPLCVDANHQPVAAQPATGNDPCSAGSEREFAPINDIHVGVVTTSIGGHGSDACPAMDTFSCAGGGVNTTNNDMGHLITRSDPCGGPEVPTYQSRGFLAWDPTGTANTPPGDNNVTNFTTGIKDLVIGAGQIGCGYESQLESWYRFLVDPSPYQTIKVDATGSAVPQGTDNVLLQQRKEFLRSDSMLAILMLSDEDDCSTKEFGQFYFSNQQRDPANPNKNFFLPRARSECAIDPNDKCCASCGEATPQGCPADPSCSSGPLDSQTDDVNLRCWDQKRRFGIDFLYPTDRYVAALTQQLVPDRAGDMAPNPIFSNLNPGTNAPIRDPGLVILAGIVGVPWQDLARDPTDLTKGYKSAEELAHKDSSNVTTWDVILGEPATYKAPLDPHMIESDTPRSGTDPITGATLAPPGSPAGTDPINGHEYTPGTKNGVQIAPDDLEYACVFPLLTPRDCSDPSQVACDCSDPQNDNPLCEPNPSNGGNRTLQVRAKAYPGIRQLNVIRDLGPQGVAASICPAQQTDTTRADYAYRPAVRALLERVSTRLKGQGH